MVCIEIRDTERAKPPSRCPLINLQHFCYIGIVQNKLTTLEISETEEGISEGGVLGVQFIRKKMKKR